MDRANQRTNHLLSRNIKRLRLKKGLGNKDMVARLQTRNVDVAVGTCSKIEMRLGNPGVNLLIALTGVFGCDFNAFSVNEEESRE